MTKQLSRRHRYQEVARTIAGQIEARAFRAGDRIPSVRELASQLGTSPATVFAAYGKLERAGLIEARPQSGFYVRPTIEPPPEPAPARVASAASAVTTADLVHRLMQVGHRADVLALDAATPAAELLPRLALSRALGRAVRRGAGHADYCYPPGLLALRRALAGRALRAGAAFSPGDVVVTGGATEALTLCLRAVARPGDAIVVESPTYYGALMAIAALGLRALEIPTDPRHGISLPHLAAALRRRRPAACFVMPSFANPLGSRMPDDAKAELVRMLARAGVPLIEDDVAGELAFEGRRPRTAQSYDRRGLVMLVSSISKTLAPGWRIGWSVPGRFRDRVMELQWSSSIAPSTPSQLAAAEFLRSGSYDRQIRRLSGQVEQTMRAMSDAIARQFPPGTTLTRPRGGLVLWLTVPGIDGVALHAAALAAGVAIMPGALFSPRGHHAHSLRLSCAVTWTPAIERAIARLGELAGQGPASPRSRSP